MADSIVATRRASIDHIDVPIFPGANRDVGMVGKCIVRDQHHPSGAPVLVGSCVGGFVVSSEKTRYREIGGELQETISVVTAAAACIPGAIAGAEVDILSRISRRRDTAR